MSTRRRPYHPDQVHPALVAFIARARVELADQGLDLLIWEGWRTPERGRLLKRRGSSQLGAHSPHCARHDGAPLSRAVDLVCARVVGGFPVGWGSSAGIKVTPDQAAERAELGAQFFAALGALVTAEPDLEWGGSWRWSDPAHVQLRAGVPMAPASSVGDD